MRTWNMKPETWKSKTWKHENVKNKTWNMKTEKWEHETWNQKTWNMEMKAWSRRRRRMARRCSACSCYMSTTHWIWKREKMKLMYRLRCMIRDSEFNIRDLRFENMTMKPWNMENENSEHEKWKMITWNMKPEYMKHEKWNHGTGEDGEWRGVAARPLATCRRRMQNGNVKKENWCID